MLVTMLADLKMLVGEEIAIGDGKPGGRGRAVEGMLGSLFSSSSGEEYSLSSESLVGEALPESAIGAEPVEGAGGSAGRDGAAEDAGPPAPELFRLRGRRGESLPGADARRAADNKGAMWCRRARANSIHTGIVISSIRARGF